MNLFAFLKQHPSARTPLSLGEGLGERCYTLSLRCSSLSFLFLFLNLIFSLFLHMGSGLEAVGIEFPSRACTQAIGLDVFGWREAGTRFRTLRGDAHGEDGQVVELHSRASQCQLPDTFYHVGDDALDDTFRKRGVVERHVLSQLFDVLGLVDH